MMFEFKVDVYHHFPPGGPSLEELLLKMEKRIMSAFSDKLTALTTSVDAALARVQAEEADHVAKEAELQAIIDAGATPEQLQELADDKVKMDSMAVTNPAVLPDNLNPATP